MAHSPSSRGAASAAAVLLARRRRAPSSVVERARRRAFGAEWGKFMHDARKHLQEANRE